MFAQMRECVRQRPAATKTARIRQVKIFYKMFSDIIASNEHKFFIFTALKSERKMKNCKFYSTNFFFKSINRVYEKKYLKLGFKNNLRWKILTFFIRIFKIILFNFRLENMFVYLGPIWKLDSSFEELLYFLTKKFHVSSKNLLIIILLIICIVLHV